jgi:hypothetical protein
VSPDEQAAAQEMLDAEKANRLDGPTIQNQARLGRARRTLEELLARQPAER